MKTERTYSTKDLVGRCFGCRYLSGSDWFYGFCINKSNRVKDRQRNALSKACVHKEIIVFNEYDPEVKSEQPKRDSEKISDELNGVLFE